MRTVILLVLSGVLIGIPIGAVIAITDEIRCVKRHRRTEIVAAKARYKAACKEIRSVSLDDITLIDDEYWPDLAEWDALRTDTKEK
jgi:hypothetical protein